MNSFEQIKALLELKEKGAISDADFKKMLDILEAESKKETEQKLEHKTKNEANHDTRLNADEARVERESEKRFNEQEKRKELGQKMKVYGFVIGIALILAFVGYCSNKKSSANVNESQDAKETTYLENADTLAKVEHEDALKQKFLAHQYINSQDANLNKYFGVVFLQYTVQNEYRRSSTALGLQQPDALIKDPQLIQLLNQKFGLNVNTQQQPKPKPKPELQPEPKLKTEPKPVQQQRGQQQQQPRQEQSSSAELPEFPEKFIIEAEGLKKKINDETVSSEVKKLAAERIKAIKKDYVSNVDKKWKENPQVQRKLNSCYTVADNYKQ
jgi:uncharacterized protein YbcC (UPF0753/DUF2309 family)